MDLPPNGRHDENEALGTSQMKECIYYCKARVDVLSIVNASSVHAHLVCPEAAGRLNRYCLNARKQVQQVS